MTEIRNSNINVKSIKAYVKTQEITGPRRDAKVEKVAREEIQDKITLSPQAREASAMVKKLHTLPDFRAEKIASLKARIEAGEYHIDSKLIAEKMLRRDQDIDV